MSKIQLFKILTVGFARQAESHGEQGDPGSCGLPGEQNKNMQQEALIGLFTLSGTLGGILIGSIFTTIGINIREKNETKRVLEGFAYNLAKEYWAKAVKMADKRGGAVDPLESFIISVKTLMKLTEKDRLDEETIKEILSEHSQVMSVVKKHYDKK